MAVGDSVVYVWERELFPLSLEKVEDMQVRSSFRSWTLPAF